MNRASNKLNQPPAPATKSDFKVNPLRQNLLTNQLQRQQPQPPSTQARPNNQQEHEPSKQQTNQHAEIVRTAQSLCFFFAANTCFLLANQPTNQASKQASEQASKQASKQPTNDQTGNRKHPTQIHLQGKEKLCAREGKTPTGNGEKPRTENADQTGNRKHPPKAGTENTQPKSVWEGKTPTKPGTENTQPREGKNCARGKGKHHGKGKRQTGNRKHPTRYGVDVHVEDMRIGGGRGWQRVIAKNLCVSWGCPFLSAKAIR